jgi:hypothetical protein
MDPQRTANPSKRAVCKLLRTLWQLPPRAHWLPRRPEILRAAAVKLGLTGAVGGRILKVSLDAANHRDDPGE